MEKRAEQERKEGQGAGRADAQAYTTGAKGSLCPYWCQGECELPGMAPWHKGRCQQCVYGCQPPEGRRRKDSLAGLLCMLLCVNHPDSPGALREVMPTETCANFRARRAPSVRVEPPEPPSDDIRYIALTRGLYATVDAADYEWLNKRKWYAQPGGCRGGFYAARTKNGRSISMHREIMKPKDDEVVDHVNGHGLNNRRRNLRVCTQLQNSQNNRRAHGKSRFRGVFPRGRKWEACIQYDGQPFYLGLFDDEIEAAKARDRKAVELGGEFAYRNLPEEDPPEPASRKGRPGRPRGEL